MSIVNRVAGSGGGGGCFREGTLIQQENGKTIPIELIKEGDPVLSYNEEGEIHLSTVTEVHYHDIPEPLIRIKFWNGFLDITPNHWVLNQYCSFIEAGRLTENDAFIDGMGHLRPIISIEELSPEPVWNLTVTPNHTFIANNIKVHNGGYRNRYPIAGAGGGGGGGGKGGGGTQHVPVEAADSLLSRQYARVIDLLSEGEIVGLVDGLKSVYLDSTPLQASDGTMNFTGITYDSRLGTQSQTYIPGFGTVESEVAVSTEVKYNVPVTRSISSTNTDAIRVTIGFPALAFQNATTGDMTGSAVDIAIDTNTNGAGWVEKVTDTISGKTTSLYQRSYRIELTRPGPWDVRVRRLTADSVQSNLRNETWWSSYTLLTDTKLRYPNSAIFAASIDSAQFRSIPSRGYDIKGIKVKIPSNYNPLTRVYTGVWNGTFSVDWTDNPAWCFYDIVTNSRYGLGTFISESQVDKWALYNIAKYCDQLVSDGFGGLEPRFTCNLYLQTREDAYKVINSMASIFRGLVYWSAGTIVPVQDSPSNPVALFTPSNVIDGQFNYEGTSAKARHTVALVSWNDPTDRYHQKIEYVEDQTGIDRFGIVQTDLIAVGCTSRGQAHRIGRWLLYTERLESEVISFKAGMEGLGVNPGEIIKVTDPIRAGQRMGGRIVSATTSTIIIDQYIPLDAGKTYTLWLVLPDGTVESKSVTNSTPSLTNTLYISGNFSQVAQVNAIWVLGSNSLVPETWRVISISEVDQTQAAIVAVAYREDKYLAVENDLILEPLLTNSSNIAPPNPVTNLSAVESLYQEGTGIVSVRVTLSWTAPSNASYYVINYHLHEGNENVTEVSTRSSSIDIGPILEGTYQFSVTAYNLYGLPSTTNVLVQEVLGRLAPPEDVSNFSLIVVNGLAYLTWNSCTHLDVLIGGYLRIRHNRDEGGGSWNNSIDIGGLLPGIATSTTVPLLSGNYLAKWIDSSGHASVNATFISTEAADILDLNYFATIPLIDSINYTSVNTVYDFSLGGIKLSGTTYVDSMLTNIDTWGYLDLLGGNIATTGSYTPINYQGTLYDYFDVGSLQTCRLSAWLGVQPFDSNDLIDSRTANINTWLSIDGSVIDDVSAVLMVSYCTTDPSASPIWSTWQPFHVGDWTARAFKFRLDIVNGFATHNILIGDSHVIIDMPDRVARGEDILAIPPDPYSVVFPDRPFMVTPSLAITAQNMATGDYYEITNKLKSGFDIIFRNSAGSVISRTFDWQARGY